MTCVEARQLNTGAAMADDQHERRAITSQAACDGWGGGNIAAKLKTSAKGSAGATSVTLQSPNARACVRERRKTLGQNVKGTLRFELAGCGAKPAVSEN